MKLFFCVHNPRQDGRRRNRELHDSETPEGELSYEPLGKFLPEVGT